MAPELRKRKTTISTSASNGNQKVAKQTMQETKSKRKAGNDASPVTLKKQKSESKTVRPSKPTPATKVIAEEEKLDLSEDSESEEDGPDHAQELARVVDSDDDAVEATDKKKSDGFKAGQDVGKIPKIPKGAGKADSSTKSEPGVIYIGRIPHGFYEYEMRQYFSQFGHITKLRLSRNKKTGASKHFAFVEFAEAPTAEVVAKTMDNYLLFGHILKCKTIPKEQVHADLFKGSNKRFKKVPWNKMAGKQLEKPMSKSTWEGKVAREQTKRDKQAAKLAALGYEFETPELKEVPDVPMIEAGGETIEDGDGTVAQVETSITPMDDKTIEITTTKTSKKSKGKGAKGTKAKAS